MLINQTAVILDGRTCAWLKQHAQLSALRVSVRGTNPHISRALEEIHIAALEWSSSVTGTTDDTEPELPRKSSQWLSTGEAADLANMTDRGIRKAITEGRLEATKVGGRNRISREDLEHYKAARAA